MPERELQRPFDVAVVIPTIGRPALMRAVRSVWEQDLAGRIQIMVGFDRPSSDHRQLNALTDGPPHCATTILNLGYSTSQRNGGLYPGHAGGAVRTLLSYAANARYVAYLDDDNWWGPAHLSSLLRAIRGVEWAFSLRWFVDSETNQPLSVDLWESVGPGSGAYNDLFGGFVDTNCLMIDKLACDPALRHWCYPLPGDLRAMSEDRTVFDYLRRNHTCRASGVASAYYVMQADDCMHPQRLRWIASLKSAVGTQPSPPRQSLASAAGDETPHTIEATAEFAWGRLTHGRSLYQQGRLDDAMATFQQAVAAQPDLSEAHLALGQVYAAQGRIDEAISADRRALALKGDLAAAHHHLGLILWQTGQCEAAVASCRQAIGCAPDFVAALSDLGSFLAHLGHHDEAMDALREALRLQPDLAMAHNNAGIVCWQVGRYDEAVASCRRALELDPGLAEAENNLATALRDLGQFEPAMEAYHRAIELRPDYAEARWNRSLLALLQGDFSRGWQDYESRWQLQPCHHRDCGRPLWDGSSPEGKTILMAAEQGLGDTIQFLRYAPLLKRRGARVLAEVHRPLRRLAKTCPGIDQLVVLGEAPPAFDVYAPMLSLPRLCQTTLENIPAEVPYLSADAGSVEAWKAELSGRAGFKIGVAWQGSPQNAMDRRRSFPLACLAPLAEVPGVTLISLQKGIGAQQIAEVADRFQIVDFGPRLDDNSGPFVDTSAIIQCVDLVVTCDSALAHLAGALAAPVWIALMRTPDWRWLVDRQDSPWYPTARLFRQARPGDWAGVFERMAAAVAERLGIAQSSGHAS